MDDRIILSICIPVYNGGNRLVKNISNILKYEKNDIEVIVSDNQSNDGSIETLRRIEDKRLKIFVNEENVGPFKNWYLALKRGKGKYLKILLDRDVLQVEMLPDYINMIRNKEYGVILDWSGRLGSSSNRVLTEREKIFWLVQSEHPSVCTYLRNAFKDIKDDGIYNKAARGSCNVFWGISIARSSSVLINCRCPIFIDAQVNFFVLTSSRVWGYAGRIKGGGLEPVEYVRRFSFYLNYILSLDNDISKEKIIGLYGGMLIFVSPNYHNLICSTSMKHRYQVIDKNYSLDEYTKLPFGFYRKIKKILMKKGLISLGLLFDLWLVTFVNHLQFCNKNCSQMEWHVQLNNKMINYIKKKRNLLYM